MYIQYNHPLIYHILPNVWKALYTISASIFVDVSYSPPYSTDKFISYVIPGPLQWFFHVGKEIINAVTQEKVKTGATKPHHSSWQCKESHRCCRGPLAPLTMRDSATSTLFTDTSPCDYDLFVRVKGPLWATRYNTRDELIRAIGRAIRNMNKDGRADGVFESILLMCII